MYHSIYDAYEAVTAWLQEQGISSPNIQEFRREHTRSPADVGMVIDPDGGEVTQRDAEPLPVAYALTFIASYVDMAVGDATIMFWYDHEGQRFKVDGTGTQFSVSPTPC